MLFSRCANWPLISRAYLDDRSTELVLRNKPRVVRERDGRRVRVAPAFSSLTRSKNEIRARIGSHPHAARTARGGLGASYARAHSQRDCNAPQPDPATVPSDSRIVTGVPAGATAAPPGATRPATPVVRQRQAARRRPMPGTATVVGSEMPPATIARTRSSTGWP